MTHPNDTPLNEWPNGWLLMETASLLGNSIYLMMSEDEREQKGYPANREQRISFIRRIRNEVEET